MSETVQDNQVTKAKSVKNETWEWIKALLIALVLVLIIRQFLFAPFIVEGISMAPNFETGERLVVNKLLYNLRDPKRGEVIVFLAPSQKDYIKRVIGLPGDTVKVDGDKVYVNGELLPEEYIQSAVESSNKEGRPYNNTNFAEKKVPEGQLFVMGDNRSHSSDSRSTDVGFVPYDKIVGRAEVVFWPLGHMKWIH
ncbi:signal peptidase I [Paenibacillus sp. y28]|uniref:signal peptidase I n=1 Tax=Paenibacillus sp. y28 TaxID=3129110 RepID=UPI0030180BFC